MNIIEAVKSGRRFRRKGGKIAKDGIWQEPNFDEFDRDDVLADDWEIEEPSVTITLSQLKEAFDDASRRNSTERVFEALVQKLGLEPSP